jgi:fatty acid desaturase
LKADRTLQMEAANNQAHRLAHPADLDDLSLRSDWIYFEVAGLYSLCFIMLYAVSRCDPHLGSLRALLVEIVAFVTIAWCQFSLTNGQHEALHRNFGKKQNDTLAALLTAYPIGMTMCYRDVHLSHHRYFGDPALDPDYAAYAYFPKSKFQFLTRLLKYSCGVVTIKQFFTQKAPTAECDKRREIGMLVLTQLAIASLFSVFLSPLDYVLFWILPIVTLGKLFSSTRTLCEHAKPGGFTLRTITGNSIQTMILGMFHFNFHAEHHLYPRIPYTKLADAQRVLADRIVQRNQDREVYDGGYINLLVHWFWMLPLFEGSKERTYGI